jgi:hypothetical protein
VDGREFVWAHFKLNAEQRLRGFNFFVVLAIFADGGVLAALQQGFSPGLLILLGAFTVLLAQVFWLVDARSRQLLELTIVALKEMEANYPESYRLFAADALGQSRVISYTFAIRALLLAQMGFAWVWSATRLTSGDVRCGCLARRKHRIEVLTRSHRGGWRAIRRWPRDCGERSLPQAGRY